MSEAAERRALIRVSIAVAVLTLGAKLLGGVLQVIIAARFGASAQLDAYLVAISLPTLVAEWFIVAAPAVVLVPLVAELRHDGLHDAAWRLVCTFGNTLLVVVAAVIALAFAAGPQAVGVLAPGLDPSVKALAASLLRWTSLMLVPALASGVMRAMLYSHDRFFTPALAVASSTATTIVLVAVLPGTVGVRAIVWAVLTGNVVGLFVSVAGSRGLWRSWYVGRDVTAALARRSAALLVTYLLIGTAAQVNFLSDRFFASFLPAGSISIFEYGEKLASFLMLAFAAAVAVPAYTAFSRSVAAADRTGLRDRVVGSTRLVAVVTLPMLAASIALRGPIVRFLLRHGLFSSGQADAVATVFGYLCVVSAIYAFAQVLTYAFFSLQETWRFLLVVVAGIALNIALDVVLVGPLGLSGLAIATASSTLASNSVLWWMLAGRIEGLRGCGLSAFFARTGASALLAGVTAAAVLSLLEGAGAAPLAAGAFGVALPMTAAGVVYVAACRALRVPEIGQIWESLTTRLAKQAEDEAPAEAI